MTRTGDDVDAPSPDPRQCKVGRLLEEYGIEPFGDELVARWTATGDEEASLRTLATDFNRRLLGAAMEAAGLTPIEGEVENLHDLLVGEGVSSGVRTEAENRLQREGIDVDGLLDDFVSHQAVHTYLTKYRNASKSTRRGDPAERGTRTIQRLQNRLAAVTANTVGRVVPSDGVTEDDVDVLVEVQVVCRDCGRQYDAVGFMSSGGCDCGADPRRT